MEKTDKTLDELFEELKQAMPPELPEPVKEMLVNTFRFLLGQ